MINYLFLILAILLGSANAETKSEEDFSEINFVSWGWFGGNKASSDDDTYTQNLHRLGFRYINAKLQAETNYGGFSSNFTFNDENSLKFNEAYLYTSSFPLRYKIGIMKSALDDILSSQYPIVRLGDNVDTFLMKHQGGFYSSVSDPAPNFRMADAQGDLALGVESQHFWLTFSPNLDNHKEGINDFGQVNSLYNNKNSLSAVFRVRDLYLGGEYTRQNFDINDQVVAGVETNKKDGKYKSDLVFGFVYEQPIRDSNIFLAGTLTGGNKYVPSADGTYYTQQYRDIKALVGFSRSFENNLEATLSGKYIIYQYNQVNYSAENAVVSEITKKQLRSFSVEGTLDYNLNDSVALLFSVTGSKYLDPIVEKIMIDGVDQTANFDASKKLNNEAVFAVGIVMAMQASSDNSKVSRIRL